MAAADAPDIPDSDFENPFAEGTFLHALYGKVVSEDRDLVIIVSDKHGRRGTSKTTTSLQLADMMDRTPQGLTFDKCSLSPEELRNAYSLQPEGSGLVFDEAEVGAGNRDAMTITNKALREIVSMARVQQKYLVVNAPIKGFIDKDILKLADVWIAMERRGRGLVHHLKWEPYRERLLTEKKQRIELSDIPTGTQLRDVYNQLTREKRAHIDGEEGTKFITKSEHEEALERREKDVRQATRNETIRDIHERLNANFDMDDDLTRLKRTKGISQSMIGEALGLSQQQVGNILNG